MNDYYENLPKKRMGAGILLFTKKKGLLVLKPSYKDYWTIPGGVVEKNESPREAVIREAREEIGLNIENPKFLCVDYISRNSEKGDNLQFIFYGGILQQNKIYNIKIDHKEIVDYKFVQEKETVKLFGQGRKLSIRLQKCLKALNKKTAIYLEDGELQPSEVGLR